MKLISVGNHKLVTITLWPYKTIKSSPSIFFTQNPELMLYRTMIHSLQKYYFTPLVSGLVEHLTDMIYIA